MVESFMDFGELSSDENFKRKMIDFRISVQSASNMLETFFTKYNYDELTSEDKIRYNLFLAFAVNSYFWMYLRVRGIDPTQHEIKEQINRVREYMNRSKKIYEKRTKMPRIDQDAVGRFVRSGLWTPQNNKASTSVSDGNLLESKVSRKRKRDNSDNN